MGKKPEQVGEKALVVVEEARALVIRSNEDYEKAEAVRLQLIERMNNIDDAYNEIISTAYSAWKAALAKKASYYDKVKEAATFIKKLQGDYKEERKRWRQAEEARLRAEAIRQEEERRRQEAELAPEDEKDLILNEPIVIAPVVIPDDTPKGPVFREIWDAEVFDLLALVKGVAEEKVDLKAITPNATFLRQQAGSLKDTLRIPGVRSYSRKV